MVNAHPPHTRTVASYALASTMRIPAIVGDAPVAPSAAVLGLLSWLFAVSNTQLLSVVLAAMLANILVGAFWAAVNPKVEFSVQRLYGGLLGKAFRLLVIPVGSLIDKLFLLSPFGGATADATQPVVAFLMWALAIAEIVSTLHKFIEAGVVPVALAALIARLEAAPQNLPPGLGGVDRRDGPAERRGDGA